MAYRPLVEGDKVKVMEKNHGWFNNFGEVIEVSEKGAEVHVGNNRRWFKQSDLMVASDDLSGSIYRFRNIDLDDVEEPACEFEDCDHDDLVDMIVKLRNNVSTLSDCIVDKDNEIIRLKMELKSF